MNRVVDRAVEPFVVAVFDRVFDLHAPRRFDVGDFEEHGLAIF